jgi:hypothetical protein
LSHIIQVALSKLKAAAGLALINQKSYAAAARKFLECSSDHLNHTQHHFSQVRMGGDGDMSL